MGRFFVASALGIALAVVGACALDRAGEGDDGSGFGGTSTSSSISSAKSSSSVSSSSPASSSSSGAPDCSDGKMNEDETDIDCGGALCPSCELGQHCQVGKDCASHVCSKGVCAVAPILDWLQVMTQGPAPRIDYAISEDALGHVILFGGSDSAGGIAFGDQWIFDGAGWTAFTTMVPSLREAPAIAYDSVRAKTVLFGGAVPFVGYLNDTFEWDGSAWAPKTIATPPDHRMKARMAFDPIRKKTVLFGGINDVGVLGDTWVYDASGWAKQSPATLPPPRYYHEMAFDASSGRVLLFGGRDATGAFSDTWAWDGADWTDVMPATSYTPRYAAESVSDPENKQIVLHGGVDELGGVLADTWVFDGSDWSTRTFPLGQDPGVVIQASMTFVTSKHHAILYATWNGTTAQQSTWELFTVGGGCGASTDCGNGLCVENLCCDWTCAMCESCATIGNAGFCAPVTGSDCDAGGE